MTNRDVTNRGENNGDFESRLGDLLEERAHFIEVHPDLDAITCGADGLPTDPRAAHTFSVAQSGRRSWLLAAAALLIVGVIGGAALLDGTDDTSDPDVDDELAAPAGLAPEELADLMDSLATPEGPGEVIIWLEPEADGADIQAVGDWLDGRGVVQGWSYVDTDQTWADYQKFWADEPEVIDTVRPEQLPTSYRVFTNDPVTLQRVLERSGLGSIRQIDLPDEAELGITPDDALYLLPADQPLPESRLSLHVQTPAEASTVSTSVLTVGRPIADGYDRISRISHAPGYGAPPEDYVTTVIDGRTVASPPDDPRLGFEPIEEGYLVYDSWQPISPELVRSITVVNGEVRLSGPFGGIEELSRRQEIGAYRAGVSLATSQGMFLQMFDGVLVPRIREGLPPDFTDEWIPGFSLETRVAESVDDLLDGWGSALEAVDVGGEPGFLARIDVQLSERTETITQLRWFREGTGEDPNHIVTLSIPGLSDAELIDYALALEPVDAETWQAAVAQTASDVAPPGD